MAGLPSGKAEVCKTSMSRFDSDTRLHPILCNLNQLQRFCFLEPDCKTAYGYHTWLPLAKRTKQLLM